MFDFKLKHFHKNYLAMRDIFCTNMVKSVFKTSDESAFGSLHLAELYVVKGLVKQKNEVKKAF